MPVRLTRRPIGANVVELMVTARGPAGHCPVLTAPRRARRTASRSWRRCDIPVSRVWECSARACGSPGVYRWLNRPGIREALAIVRGFTRRSDTGPRSKHTLLTGLRSRQHKHHVNHCPDFPGRPR